MVVVVLWWWCDWDVKVTVNICRRKPAFCSHLHSEEANTPRYILLHNGCTSTSLLLYHHTHTHTTHTHTFPLPISRFSLLGRWDSSSVWVTPADLSLWALTLNYILLIYLPLSISPLTPLCVYSLSASSSLSSSLSADGAYCGQIGLGPSL